MISIVIPAHNEETTIGDLLASLTIGAEPGEMEIIVAANGCSDRTSDVARSFDSGGTRVQVLELSEGNKPAALNAADRAAIGFPRFYIDSDVAVGLDAVLACRAALEAGAMAAAPQLTVDTSRSTWAVRAYYRVWLSAPWVTNNLVGSGFIGLSAAARARFEDFPAIGADDLWVASHIAGGEREVVQSHTFSVVASPNARQLVKRNARIRAANHLLREADLPSHNTTEFAWTWRSLIRARTTGPDAIAFLLITAATKLTTFRVLRGGMIEWNGDRGSSQVPIP